MDLPTFDNLQLVAAVAVAAQLVAYLTIPSVLLRRTSRPVGQLAWILALLALPIVGVMAWWVWGRTRVERRRQRHQKARRDFTHALKEASPQDDVTVYNPDNRIAILDNEVFPTTTNNCVELLVSGAETFPSMLAAIRSATHHVHIEFYIWNADETGKMFRDALIKKAEEGVAVRVLVDAVGSNVALGSFMDPLRNAGAEVAVFLPLRLFERRLRVNFRNHRKILVVDGTVGFTGGINIGDEYNDWYDAMFGFEGGVVNQLQEVFCEDWYFATGEDLTDPDYYEPHHTTPFCLKEGVVSDVIARVVASGPDNDLELIHSLFFLAITRAERRVWITTPYFVPDDAILTALRTAVLRGVDVRLLLPGKSDVQIARLAGRGYFDQLLRSGVKIYEYQPSILHAKLMVVDEAWSIVGSANMDIRSFRLQFEANAVMLSQPLNEQLSDLFERQLEDSLKIELDTWEERSTIWKLVEATARLFSPQL